MAGITIATLMGENGIITQAKKADLESSHAAVKEAIILLEINCQVQDLDVYTAVQGYMKEGSADIINTEKLLGSKTNYGNGSGDKDVYKIEKDGSNVVLRYYDKKTDETMLWSSEQGSVVQPSVQGGGAQSSGPVPDDFWVVVQGCAVINPKYLTVRGILTSSNATEYVGDFLQGHSCGYEVIEVPLEARGISSNELVPVETFTIKGIVDVKTLIVPEGIELLESGACAYAIGLENIQLPSSLVRIEDEAFAECKSLTRLEIPEGCLYVEWGIGAGSGIRELIVPSSVREMDDTKMRDGAVVRFRCTESEAQSMLWSGNEWLSVWERRYQIEYNYVGD